MSGKIKKQKAPVEKPKNFKATIKRLITYLSPYKSQITMVIVFAIISGVFAIISPKVMGGITTELFKVINGEKINFNFIKETIVLLIMFYIISSVFSYLQQHVMAGVTQKAVYTLRKEIDEKIERLPLKYFDTMTHGELLSRVTNDVDNVSSTLQQSLTQIITSAITIVGVFIMMLSINIPLTMVILITIPLSTTMMKGIAAKSQQQFVTQQKKLGNLNGHVEEMYGGHNVIKAFSREKFTINDFDNINKELFEVGWKAQFLSGLIMPIITFINNLSYVIIAVIGGVFVAKGRISIGDIQAFIQYSKQFTQPIAQTANIFNVIQSTAASAERIFELLDQVEKILEASNLEHIDKLKGSVKFKDVRFGYSPDRILMKGLNIDVKPGQKVGIVGPTGAGKSTMINILLRFYELNGGEIIIDGRNITNLSRAELRSNFGMVLQDTWLFKGTIKENLAYGKEGATDEEIIAAAKAAYADHFIRTLPQGYDTLLTEDATNISQGQRQLLTIARAMVSNPPMLILDEATSSVDTRTELHIQEATQNIMKGRTSFVIAHRLSTIKDADLILVMKNGDVVEKGTHETLMKEIGIYSDLYNSQFSN